MRTVSTSQTLFCVFQFFPWKIFNVYTDKSINKPERSESFLLKLILWNIMSCYSKNDSQSNFNNSKKMWTKNFISVLLNWETDKWFLCVIVSFSYSFQIYQRKKTDNNFYKNTRNISKFIIKFTHNSLWFFYIKNKLSSAQIFNAPLNEFILWN